MFGIGLDSQLWRYRVSGGGAGWLPTDHYGDTLEVGNVGDASAADDVAVIRDNSGQLWTWDQLNWSKSDL